MKKKKKRKKRELCQPSCRKLGEKFNSNLGNEVAENEGGKKDLGQNLKGKRKLWQWNCQNGRKKKIVAVDLWQCCCRNGRKKKM